MLSERIEKAYSHRICKDYNLLYSYAENDFGLVCCFNTEKIGDQYIRKVYQILNNHSFDGLYLAFLDNDPEHKKENFIRFCKQADLTFILP